MKQKRMHRLLESLFGTPEAVLPLKNRYFALRHGESNANKLRRIVSDPEVGCRGEWGLTPSGQAQVHRMVALMPEVVGHWVVVTSGFARHRQTAELFVRGLVARGTRAPGTVRVARIFETARVNERYFGSFDGKMNIHYETVWANDALGLDDKAHDVETVRDVERRMAEIVRLAETDNPHAGVNVVIVSSADPLMMLQALFEDRTARGAFRKLPYLEYAELRELKLVQSEKEKHPHVKFEIRTDE